MKDKKQLFYFHGVVYTNCVRVADCNITLTLTLRKEKGKYYNSKLFLNRILKWTIYSGAGARMAQKMSLYLEF